MLMKIFLSFLGIANLDDILGQRPGELFGCIHACGNLVGVELLKIARCMRSREHHSESSVSKSKIVDECRITSIIEGKSVNFDLQITANPVRLHEKNFTILALADISSLKRKEVLEKLFLHDILNLSNNLQGFVELLHDLNNRNEIRSFLDQISKMVSQLNNEILSQRELVEAEKGDLALTLSEFELKDYASEVIQAAIHHDAAIGKDIVLGNEIKEGMIQTDKALLTRVVVNMIKNALEAEPIGSTIFITFQY